MLGRFAFRSPLSQSAASLSQCPLFYRAFGSVASNELRQGMVFVNNGVYCEVTEFRVHKMGRGAASSVINYIELHNQKAGSVKLPSTTKVDRPDLDKCKYSLMYVDKDNKKLVIADESFDEHSVPLSLAMGAEAFLEPGTEITVWKNGEDVVKITLPTAIVNKVKRK